jgi:type IV pilus assembly protein PilW
MKATRRQSGFTLVELMISMMLGIVVVGGVISVLLANRKSYRTTEGISQIQESARTAFELMARDIRQAGASGCDGARADSDRRMATVLTGTAWWANWESVRGYNEGQVDPAVTQGTAVGQRVAGTDTLHMHGIDGAGYAVSSHNPTTFRIVLQGTAPLAAGDVLMICDFDHTALFRATGYSGSTIAYASGGSSGNCSTGLNFPENCASSTGNVYQFQQNAWVGRVNATVWYIGNNGRPDDGDRSLFRLRLDAGGIVRTEEVVAGVSDLQIRFSRNNDDTLVDATSLSGAQWDAVNAAFVRLVASSSEARVTTDPGVATGRLTRPFTYVVTLRNRVP